MDKQTMIDKLEGIQGAALSALSEEGEIANESQLSFIARMARDVLNELRATDLKPANSEQPEAYQYAIMMKGESAKIVDAADTQAMERAQDLGRHIVAQGKAEVSVYSIQYGLQVNSEERYYSLRKRIDKAIDALNGM